MNRKMADMSRRMIGSRFGGEDIVSHQMRQDETFQSELIGKLMA